MHPRGVYVTVGLGEVFPGDIRGEDAAFGTTEAVVAVAAAAHGEPAVNRDPIGAEERLDRFPGGPLAGEIEAFAALFRGAQGGGGKNRRPLQRADYERQQQRTTPGRPGA